MKRLLLLILLSCSASLCWVVSGKAPSLEVIQQLTADYFAKRPSRSIPEGLTLDEARQTQKAFVAQLSKKLGKKIGYKVGLTSKAAQELAGASSPVRGVLLSKMMLKDRAEVSAHFGARPLYEADLIAVVKDPGVNEAKTPLEALQHLSEIIAFIELPDRIVSEEQKMDVNVITAINSGARLGILGQRVKIKPAPEFVTALETMTVVATDESGTELVSATGKALLGNPLNAVLWLIKDLATTGEALNAGDMISLGSFSKPQVPHPGQTVTVRYNGLLGGPMKVSVRFRE